MNTRKISEQPQVCECKSKQKNIPDYAKKAHRESIGEDKKNIGKESGKNPVISPGSDIYLSIFCLRLYVCQTRFCRHREKSSRGICRASFRISS